jgi:hypothetical protein
MCLVALRRQHPFIHLHPSLKEAEKRRNTPRGAVVCVCQPQMPVEEFSRNSVLIDVLRTDPSSWIRAYTKYAKTRLDYDFCFTAQPIDSGIGRYRPSTKLLVREQKVS